MHIFSLNKQTIFLTFLSSFLLLSSNVQAQTAVEPNQGNEVQFSITESQNVPNDSISMTFNRVAEGTSLQAVANEINLKMQAAVSALKAYPEIITQTTQYNIRPVYKKQVMSHWRGQQSLVLTLENKPGLIKVLAKIQPYLAYQSMQFGVSDDLQDKILAQLTDRAILKFRNQANRIAQGFQAPSYKILETRINMPNTVSPRPMYARSEMAMMSSDMAAPSVKAGQSKLKVTISGTVLLPN
ncbi:MAG: SIMPL domain-containing protein [Pseudomonadota bacterium]|nr:SIMPL domain-containing protein [Pseudomonadota bacterium]